MPRVPELEQFKWPDVMGIQQNALTLQKTRNELEAYPEDLALKRQQQQLLIDQHTMTMENLASQIKHRAWQEQQTKPGQKISIPFTNPFDGEEYEIEGTPESIGGFTDAVYKHPRDAALDLIGGKGQLVAWGAKQGVGFKKAKAEAEGEGKSKTDYQSAAATLAEELGRPPTEGEIRKRMQADKEKQAQAGRAVFGLQQATNLPPGWFIDRLAKKILKPDGTQATPEEIASGWTEAITTKATGSALTDVTKRKALVDSFVLRIDATSDVVMDLAKKVSNTDARFINAPINELWKRKIIGDGDLASLNLALTSLSREVGKVEQGQLGISGLSDSAAMIMDKIHDLNLPLSELQKVIDTGKQLGVTARKALGMQVEEVKGALPGGKAKKETGTPKPKSKFTILEVK